MPLNNYYSILHIPKSSPCQKYGRQRVARFDEDRHCERSQSIRVATDSRSSESVEQGREAPQPPDEEEEKGSCV